MKKAAPTTKPTKKRKVASEVDSDVVMEDAAPVGGMYRAVASLLYANADRSLVVGKAPQKKKKKVAAATVAPADRRKSGRGHAKTPAVVESDDDSQADDGESSSDDVREVSPAPKKTAPAKAKTERGMGADEKYEAAKKGLATWIGKDTSPSTWFVYQALKVSLSGRQSLPPSDAAGRRSRACAVARATAFARWWARSRSACAARLPSRAAIGRSLRVPPPSTTTASASNVGLARPRVRRCVVAAPSVALTTWRSRRN